MNFQVNVTVDLGDKTINLLKGGIFAKTETTEAKKPEREKLNTSSEEYKERIIPNALESEEVRRALAEKEEPAPEQPKTEAKENPKPEPKKRRTKEEIEADSAKAAEGWDAMDEDEQLEAIKAEVTRHVKKGKSADIKFMLSHFDADRASSLNPEDYKAFFDAVQRYGNGESVTDIFPT